MTNENQQLMLIAGFPSTGKSASLRNIPNQQNWLYLNTESGKRLPFKNKFKTTIITDPLDVLDGFDYAQQHEKIEGIIIDSLTFLMEMYESVYIINAANGMKAWSDYGQFFKTIMQEKVPNLGKPIIFTAHVKEEYNEATLDTKTSIPVKGALKNIGVEAYFSTIVSSKRVPLKELKKYKSSLLTVTEEDEVLGFKHVFQTRLTKNTTGERIRSPMGMFAMDDTYIDSDANLLLNHLKDFYSND